MNEARRAYTPEELGALDADRAARLAVAIKAIEAIERAGHGEIYDTDVRDHIHVALTSRSVPSRFGMFSTKGERKVRDLVIYVLFPLTPHIDRMDSASRSEAASQFMEEVGL